MRLQRENIRAVRTTLLLGLAAASVSALLVVTAESGAQPQAGNLKKPMKTVDTSGANLPAFLQQHIDGVAHLVVNKPVDNSEPWFCTGAHIGGGYILTAGHCLLNAGKRQSEPSRTAACEGIDVRLGDRGEGIFKGRGHCTGGAVFEYSAERDFAVFATDLPANAPTIKFDRSIPISKTEMYGVGKPATVYVFGHPLDERLHWSDKCDAFGMAAAPFLKNRGYGQERFVHQCSTYWGVSGGPVFSASGQLIGIHNEGECGATDEAIGGWCWKKIGSGYEEAIPWNPGTLLGDATVATVISQLDQLLTPLKGTPAVLPRRTPLAASLDGGVDAHD